MCNSWVTHVSSAGVAASRSGPIAWSKRPGLRPDRRFCLNLEDDCRDQLGYVALDAGRERVAFAEDVSVASPRAPEAQVDHSRHNASLETEGSYGENHRNPVTEEGQTAIRGSEEDQGARAD